MKDMKTNVVRLKVCKILLKWSNMEAFARKLFHLLGLKLGSLLSEALVIWGTSHMVIIIFEPVWVFIPIIGALLRIF